MNWTTVLWKQRRIEPHFLCRTPQFLDPKSFQVPDYVPVSTHNSKEGQRLLQAEIQKLGDSAQVVEIAFRSVSWGLDTAITVATASEQTSRLCNFKRLWDGHHKKYVELVWESRRVAGHARATATDFAGDFLDVIKDQAYSVEEKKQEIAAYRQELEKDMKESQKPPQGFVELHAAVVALKGDLQKYIDEYTKDKEAKINRLVADIEKMQENLKRVCTMRGAPVARALEFASSCFLLQPYVNQYHELLNREKQLKKELGDFQRHLEGMNKIYMDLIEDKLQIFAQIWSFIHSDLNAIEKELGRASNTATRRHFEQKIKAVSVTYKALATALRLYETNAHIRDTK